MASDSASERASTPVTGPGTPTSNVYRSDMLASSKLWKGAVCVFCGSSIGNDPEYQKAASQIGKALSKNGIPLVYGGGTNGLMGAVANATYNEGGRVLGIIPRALMAFERKEGGQVASSIKNPAVVETASEDDRSIAIIVKTMHERKQEMARYSEAGFIALPGGFGTFEEVMEMTTWTQLQIHTKPVILLNINGFYSSLRTFVQGAIEAGFIRKDNGGILVFVDKPGDATDAFDWGEAALQAVDKWRSQEGSFAQYKLDWATKRD